MTFSWFKRRKSLKTAAAGLYQAAVTQSRDVHFYTDLGVADTMDGRFDLVSMHVFLIMSRLRQLGPEGTRLSQALFDCMFKRMDETLREIGVGDLSVPKHMHRMMKAFNGRVHSYHAAISNGDLQELELAVVRNIYRVDDSSEVPAAQKMARYISLAAGELLKQDLHALTAGQVFFPPVVVPPEKRYA